MIYRKLDSLKSKRNVMETLFSFSLTSQQTKKEVEGVIHYRIRSGTKINSP